MQQSTVKLPKTQAQTEPKYTTKRKSLKDQGSEYSGLHSFPSNSPSKVRPGKHQKYNDFVPLFSKKRAETLPEEDELVVKQRNQTPRPIIEENLSEKQKELLKLSVFEKDMVLIKSKKEQIEKYEKENYREVEDFSIPQNFGKKRKRPKLNLEELAKPRPRKVVQKPKLKIEKIPEKEIEPISDDLYQKLNRHITPEEIAEYQDQYFQQISQRVYFGNEQQDRNYSYDDQGYAYDDEEQQQEPEEQYKSTRANQLKTNINRLKVLKMDVAERQEIVNAALRLKAEEAAQKRILERPNKQRPIDNPEKSMRDKKTDLRNNYEQYVERLDTIKSSAEKSPTLLEKIEYDSMTQYK